jgi:hypothetical protein
MACSHAIIHAGKPDNAVIMQVGMDAGIGHVLDRDPGSDRIDGGTPGLAGSGAWACEDETQQDRDWDGGISML